MNQKMMLIFGVSVGIICVGTYIISKCLNGENNQDKDMDESSFISKASTNSDITNTDDISPLLATQNIVSESLYEENYSLKIERDEETNEKQKMLNQNLSKSQMKESHNFGEKNKQLDIYSNFKSSLIEINQEEETQEKNQLVANTSFSVSESEVGFSKNISGSSNDPSNFDSNLENTSKPTINFIHVPKNQDQKKSFISDSLVSCFSKHKKNSENVTEGIESETVEKVAIQFATEATNYDIDKTICKNTAKSGEKNDENTSKDAFSQKILDSNAQENQYMGNNKDKNEYLIQNESSLISSEQYKNLSYQDNKPKTINLEENETSSHQDIVIADIDFLSNMFQEVSDSSNSCNRNEDLCNKITHNKAISKIQPSEKTPFELKENEPEILFSVYPINTKIKTRCCDKYKKKIGISYKENKSFDSQNFSFGVFGYIFCQSPENITIFKQPNLNFKGHKSQSKMFLKSKQERLMNFIKKIDHINILKSFCFVDIKISTIEYIQSFFSELLNSKIISIDAFYDNNIQSDFHPINDNIIYDLEHKNSNNSIENQFLYATHFLAKKIQTNKNICANCSIDNWDTAYIFSDIEFDGLCTVIYDMSEIFCNCENSNFGLDNFRSSKESINKIDASDLEKHKKNEIVIKDNNFFHEESIRISQNIENKIKGSGSFHYDNSKLFENTKKFLPFDNFCEGHRNLEIAKCTSPNDKIIKPMSNKDNYKSQKHHFDFFDCTNYELTNNNMSYKNKTPAQFSGISPDSNPFLDIQVQKCGNSKYDKALKSEDKFEKMCFERKQIELISISKINTTKSIWDYKLGKFFTFKKLDLGDIYFIMALFPHNDSQTEKIKINQKDEKILNLIKQVESSTEKNHRLFFRPEYYSLSSNVTMLDLLESYKNDQCVFIIQKIPENLNIFTEKISNELIDNSKHVFLTVLDQYSNLLVNVNPQSLDISTSSFDDFFENEEEYKKKLCQLYNKESSRYMKEKIDISFDDCNINSSELCNPDSIKSKSGLSNDDNEQRNVMNSSSFFFENKIAGAASVMNEKNICNKNFSSNESTPFFESKFTFGTDLQNSERNGIFSNIWHNCDMEEISEQESDSFSGITDQASIISYESIGAQTSSILKENGNDETSDVSNNDDIIFSTDLHIKTKKIKKRHLINQDKEYYGDLRIFDLSRSQKETIENSKFSEKSSDEKNDSISFENFVSENEEGQCIIFGERNTLEKHLQDSEVSIKNSEEEKNLSNLDGSCIQTRIKQKILNIPSLVDLDLEVNDLKTKFEVAYEKFSKILKDEDLYTENFFKNYINNHANFQKDQFSDIHDIKTDFFESNEKLSNTQNVSENSLRLSKQEIPLDNVLFTISDMQDPFILQNNDSEDDSYEFDDKVLQALCLEYPKKNSLCSIHELKHNKNDDFLEENETHSNTKSTYTSKNDQINTYLSREFYNPLNFTFLEDEYIDDNAYNHFPQKIEFKLFPTRKLYTIDEEDESEHLYSKEDKPHNSLEDYFVNILSS